MIEHGDLFKALQWWIQENGDEGAVAAGGEFGEVEAVADLRGAPPARAPPPTVQNFLNFMSFF